MTTYNAPPDQVNGLILLNGDTLNVAAGTTVSRVALLQGSDANIDGTIVDSVLAGGEETIYSDGTLDGISFSPDNGNAGVLDIQDITSVEGTLIFNGDLSARIAVSQNITSITSTGNTLTLHYGTDQSVIWHYQGTGVTFDLLSSHQILVRVGGLGGNPTFSPETAGTIVYTAGFGSGPDATELNVLTQFTQAQYAYGQQIGVQDPSIYAFQALGVALASTATQFQNTFGPSNPAYPVSTVGDVHFVDDAYASVFGHTGSAAQI